MTTEVIIFNKSAIALAADSAVSIDDGKSTKIYNNAEKLFTLTKHHPVALMIYGNSELQGVPWELIIKSYRKHLGEKSFDTLQEYKDDFLGFVSLFYYNLPIALQDEYLDIYLQDLVFLTLTNIFEMIGDCNDDEIREIDAIDASINNLIEEYQKLPFFDGLNEDSLEELSIDFSKFAMDAIGNEIDSSEFTDRVAKDWFNTCNSFYVLCKIRALKQDPFYKNTTGLVFAGYGDMEFFPVALECEIFGMLGDKLKVIRKPCFKNKPKAGLKAFAQRDEVDTFMQGICTPTKLNHYEHLRNIYNYAKSNITDLINEYVPEEIRDEIKDKHFELLNDDAKECFKAMEQHTRTQHVDKVVNMIAHLPKNEMAYMAESLVNLTAFKRKVSSESDSVGGPIDVAVISKGDGFVWIKRKHYFPGELNL